MRARIVLGAMAMFAVSAAGALAQTPDGSDIPTAIPIAFGQLITDIGDVKLKDHLVYKISLAKGQKLTLSGATVDGRSVQWGLFLIAPSVKTLASWTNSDTLASDYHRCCNSGANPTVATTYQVPAAGIYTIALYFYDTGTNFKFQAQAEGTPIAVPNPATAGCLTGPVNYITYSLQLIAVGLADEISIGGVKANAGATVKAPLYPEMVQRLETALRSKLNVDACYDSGGNIFQIKMAQ